jgi:hypothetical protein
MLYAKYERQRSHEGYIVLEHRAIVYHESHLEEYGNPFTKWQTAMEAFDEGWWLDFIETPKWLDPEYNKKVSTRRKKAFFRGLFRKYGDKVTAEDIRDFDIGVRIALGEEYMFGEVGYDY